MGGIGGKGDSGSDQPSTDVIGRLTPGQRKLLDQLTTELNAQVGYGMTPYPGEVVPPASGLQQQGFSMLSAMGAGDNAMAQQRDTTMMGLLAGTPGFTNDAEAKAALQQYYQDALVAPSQAEYQDALDAIAHQYGMRGAAASGSMYDAMARETTRHQINLDALKAELMRGDVTAARTSKETALERLVPAATEARTGQYQLPAAMLAGGLEQRSIASEQNYEPLWDWMISQPAYNPWLGYLGTALGTPAYQFVGMPASGAAGGKMSNAGAGISGIGTMGISMMNSGMGNKGSS